MTEHPMPEHPMLAAARALCAVLDAENDALRALDVPRATALVDAKRAATDALLASQRAAALKATPENLAMAERLQHASIQNKQLLERAIAAQNRVMACIARAVPKAAAQGGRYGAKGTMPASAAIPPVALSARA